MPPGFTLIDTLPLFCPVSFQIGITQAEKEASIAKADAWGLTLSEYVRTLLLLHDPPKRVTDVAWETFSKLGATYSQLSRIGSILKYLSHTVAAEDKNSERLSQNLQQMDKILEDLRQVVLEVRSQIDSDL